MTPTIFGKPLRIRCMQCDVEIKDVFWRLSDFEQVLYIRARCHGAEDSMESDIREIYPIFHQQDQVGMVAFMPAPSLTQPPAPPQSGALFLEPQHGICEPPPAPAGREGVACAATR